MAQCHNASPANQLVSMKTEIIPFINNLGSYVTWLTIEHVTFQHFFNMENRLQKPADPCVRGKTAGLQE